MNRKQITCACLFLKIDSELTTDDLSTIINKLYKARTEWIDIGLYLRVDIDTLKSIGSRCQDHPKKCLREMLTHRLQSCGPLTWRDLCDCLKSEPVGRNDVAQEIEEWLHPIEGTTTYRFNK